MTRQTAALAGAYLALFVDTALCDGGCDEAATITTDGIDAYAVTDREYELNVSRSGTVLRADCYHSRGRERCTGHYVWDLSAPDCWTSDPSAQIVMRDAERIDTP